ncbi:hypothetical protein AMTR_s00012p00136550 [Amborella trichopoda]|uniref:Uncharacterized protein n=1 Tax=Amborella trichopoda TaxID=13333 RepID=W1PCZ3_AMBTC|nr:hypothetical protein AMTR_s00012p00136550 [Amborella trichopoda]
MGKGASKEEGSEPRCSCKRIGLHSNLYDYIHEKNLRRILNNASSRGHNFPFGNGFQSSMTPKQIRLVAKAPEALQVVQSLIEEVKEAIAMVVDPDQHRKN